MAVLYKDFVDKIVTSLQAEYPFVNPYRLFPSPHMLDNSESVCSEYAYLCDRHANAFYYLAKKHAGYLEIHEKEYCPTEKTVLDFNPDLMDSKDNIWHFPVPQKRLKYEHSCYQKNLRRWASGTVSRKKKCRVEFVLLAACWAAGWQPEKEEKNCENICRNEMILICHDILKGISVPADIYERNDLTEALWTASCMLTGHRSADSLC